MPYRRACTKEDAHELEFFDDIFKGRHIQNMNKRTFGWLIAIFTVIGFGLRWMGIYYEGIDYQECLSAWYYQLKEVGNLRALAEFEGNYNLPYATALWLLTYLPIEPIIGIKMLSISADFLSAAVLTLVVMECRKERKYLHGLITYGLVLCSPITVMNSGYLAQSDGIYAAFAFLSFWLLYKGKPIKGMIAFGCAFAMKLQAAFAAPVLALIYWCRKKFSALHLAWIPVTIQVLCIPAIVAGCGWDIAIRVYTRLMGEYPYMYYYYPNVWTYFQDLPYYAFGKVAIGMTLVVLLLYCVLVVQSRRKHQMADYLEYFVWTAMTCAVLLPCMHERYNYLAEVLIIALAIVRPPMRIPAIILTLSAVQCYAQYFFGQSYVHPYLLAACNIGVYCYLTVVSAKGLMTDMRINQELDDDKVGEKDN